MGAGKGGKGKAPPRPRPPPSDPGPRAKVPGGRVEGCLKEWKGKFGWIQPLKPIQHELAAKHGGKIYIGQEDIEQDLSGVGANVSFFLYADASGLGAMHCIPAKAVPPAVKKQIAKPNTKPNTKQATKAAVASNATGETDKVEQKEPDRATRETLSGEPFEGKVVNWRGSVGWIKPDKTLEEEGIVLDEEFKKKKGRGRRGELYCHASDVDGEMPLVGATVMFFPYKDQTGLGAEMVQVLVQGDGEAPKPAAAEKALVANDSVKEKRNGGTGKDKAKGKGKGKESRPQKEKGPSGPNLPRERVSTDMVTGEIHEWKRKFGWIEPSEPFDHEAAQKHGGKIYVHMQDLVDGSESLDKGKQVMFHVFVDGSGLGAEEVMTL